MLHSFAEHSPVTEAYLSTLILVDVTGNDIFRPYWLGLLKYNYCLGIHVCWYYLNNI